MVDIDNRTMQHKTVRDQDDAADHAKHEAIYAPHRRHHQVDDVEIHRDEVQRARAGDVLVRAVPNVDGVVMVGAAEAFGAPVACYP